MLLGISATEPATMVWKQLIEDHQQPAMDAEIKTALEDFVERRRAKIHGK